MDNPAGATNLPSGGALSHLVEAATALANLTSGPSSSAVLVSGGGGVERHSFAASSCQEDRPSSLDKKYFIISDEDENNQQQGNHHSPSSSFTSALANLPSCGPSIAATASTSSPTGGSATAHNTPSNNNINTKEIFPSRLMAILNDTSLSDIISWLPHGRSFVIIRPDVFTESVLPKYLPPADARSSTKYPSFTRKLNRWGFRQATRGPDTGAFHHPLFQRHKPELRFEMVCQRSRDRRGSLPAKKRHVAPSDTTTTTTALTKESLDTFNASIAGGGGGGAQQQQQQPPPQTTATAFPSTPQQLLQQSLNQAVAAATVSVSGDSSSSISTNSTLVASMGIAPGITTDASLTQKALQRRNEEERMRVAKAMLYHAYLEAIQRKG